MPISITNDNFEKEVLQESRPVILDIYASWCGPCQMMMPTFNELEEEMGDDYKFASLNVDEARELSIQLGVTSVPTFLFYKDGNVQNKEVGYMSKEDLQAKIMEVFG